MPSIPLETWVVVSREGAGAGAGAGAASGSWWLAPFPLRVGFEESKVTSWTLQGVLIGEKK